MKWVTNKQLLQTIAKRAILISSNFFFLPCPFCTGGFIVNTVCMAALTCWHSEYTPFYYHLCSWCDGWQYNDWNIQWSLWHNLHSAWIRTLGLQWTARLAFPSCCITDISLRERILSWCHGLVWVSFPPAKWKPHSDLSLKGLLLASCHTSTLPAML